MHSIEIHLQGQFGPKRVTATKRKPCLTLSAPPALLSTATFPSLSIFTVCFPLRERENKTHIFFSSLCEGEKDNKEQEMAVPDADRNRHRATAAAPPRSRVSLRLLLRVASVACGIQFGWALQLSLLTPYVQELGIPHVWASIIWLCGPLSGLLVQPIVGHMSDKCTSKYGRRRPFIVAGGSAIILSVILIAHSADIGGLLGDTGENRTMAIVAFIIGFWLLDVANNMTQGPCRALLADLTGINYYLLYINKL